MYMSQLQNILSIFFPLMTELSFSSDNYTVGWLTFLSVWQNNCEIGVRQEHSVLCRNVLGITGNLMSLVLLFKCW